MNPQLIKVTNISHEKPGAAVHAWLADYQFSPGESKLIDSSKLPHNWQSLQSIFKFEFQEHLNPVPIQYTSAPPLDLEWMKKMIQEGIEAGISAGLKYFPQQSTATEAEIQKTEVPSFIPEIQQLDSKDIHVESTIIATDSKANVKDKLKRVKPVNKS